MQTIVVYSPTRSNRLKYVLDWLLRERLQLSYHLTNEEQEALAQPFCLSYGRKLPNGLSIPDTGLLGRTGIQKLDIAQGVWKEIPTFFAVAEVGYSLNFDLLSALFFLLSRYEEYYPFTPDKHGRYPAANSLQYRCGWLMRPLADEWVFALRRELQILGGINCPEGHFHFQPTYDIDMAYSHLHKGFKRIAGAYVRALMRMDVGQISERTQVLKNKQKDPYDSFRWLRQLHKEYDLKPLYFVLATARTTPFDKNIPPEHPAMVRVIKNIAREGTLGVHPSYYSDKDDKMGREKKILEHITGKMISLSRQHYIRLFIPATYRMLQQNDISEDYSMGYGSHLGFRAGTGSSFFWYDIEKDSQTTLRVHPFCFMDSTAHFEASLGVHDAFERLQAMSRILEKTGSTLVTVFHNFSLGTATEWKGWRTAYEQFLQEKAGR